MIASGPWDAHAVPPARHHARPIHVQPGYRLPPIAEYNANHSYLRAVPACGYRT